ncbi:hypothetical protein B9Z55_009103 [Caenorhabditis nigoni]|uniref:Uncharacterized protein n=1 Tax=Caenorhabditis nigoni TaxID=1611254 RepID=A0A2G5UQH4_9PELO|nr:hypothetical protein B9Z55_009103 [Caenorhabditis nigoni]
MVTKADELAKFRFETVQIGRISRPEENETGGNESGGNESGGNETGGNETGGNESGGNETGGTEACSIFAKKACGRLQKGGVYLI